jgi:hypothetical protein
MIALTLPMIASSVLAALILRAKGLNRRESIVCALLPFSVSLVLITEILGWLRMLSAWPVFWSWTAVALASALYWSRVRRSSTEATNQSHTRAEDFRKLHWTWQACALGIAALCIIVGISAIAGAPNTWDSMQYHLPRVVEWAGNRTVALYPTVDYQQLFAPPFAEFAMLHAYLLAGGDSLVNLVQWFAWIGCILGASLTAQRLGASPPIQVLTAVITATIPSAVCAASGPKNDVVVAFWILLAVYLLIAYRRSQSWILAAALGTSIGLAILTKGTAYIFLPALLLAGFLMLSWNARRRLLIHSALILVCAVALNAPQYRRNFQISGSILGFSSNDGEGHYPWRNARVTPRGVVGNVVRNIACHLGTRSVSLNNRIVNVLSGFLRRLGADPDDPATTWVGTKFEIFTLSPHEIFAGNPLHLLLFLLSGCGALIAFKTMSRNSILLLAGILASFVSLCALLRYQPWNQRIQLPLFVLASVGIAMTLATLKSRSIQVGIAWVLLAIAFPFAIFNHLRPILGGLGPHASIFRIPRETAYFLDQHENLAGDYIAAADAISRSGCSTAAIDASEEHYEYPAFALLLRRGVRRVVYAGVTNRSQAFSDSNNSPTPCAVMCLACSGNAEKQRLYGESGSRVARGKVTVFFPNASERLN